MSEYDHGTLLGQWQSISGFKRLVALDTETLPITNNVATELVCVSSWEDGVESLFNAEDGLAYLRALLLDDDVHLVLHNAAFDTIVCGVQDHTIFALLSRAYKKRRIHCTKLRQQMLTVGDVWNNGELARSIPLKHGAVSLHSLAGCLSFYFGIDISESKTAGSWRLRFGELRGLPLSQWAEEARVYAMDDAKHAAAVYLAQELEAQKLNARLRVNLRNDRVDVLKDSVRQAHAEFILAHMSSVHGVRVNPARIEQAAEDLKARHLAGLPKLIDMGLYLPKPKSARGWSLNKRGLQAVFHKALQLIGISESPEFYNVKKDALFNPAVEHISTAAQKRASLLVSLRRAVQSRRTLGSHQRLQDSDIVLLLLCERLIEQVADSDGEWKEFSTFLSNLSRAKLNPDDRLRFIMRGFVATGRTSSSNPNLQNIPRSGPSRGCFEPQEGYVYLISDFSAAEFRTLGQINFDEDKVAGSEIARQYQKNRSFDPHLFAAAKMYELERRTVLPFEEAIAIYKDETHAEYKTIKKLRQVAKALNFGLAGGLSASGFVGYARNMGLEFTVSEAERLAETWRTVWSEMDNYFKRRDAIYARDAFTDEEEDRRIYVFEREGRVRYCDGKTVACNTPFQGLAASGCKEALISIFEECYFQKNSPLYGCYPVLMVHDEIVLEAPYDGSADSMNKLRKAAARFSALMIEGMEKHTPDVPAEAEVAISTRWTKEAKAAKNADGELLVWSPATVTEDAAPRLERPLQDEFGDAVDSLKQVIARATSLPDADDDSDDDDQESDQD